MTTRSTLLVAADSLPLIVDNDIFVEGDDAGDCTLGKSKLLTKVKPEKINHSRFFLNSITKIDVIEIPKKHA
jgi:hypothetical protein